MLFRIPVLGGLQDHILMILALFWAFGYHFGHFWGTVLASIFRGFPGTSKIQCRAGVEGDLGGIWGPVNQSTEANQLTDLGPTLDQL